MLRTWTWVMMMGCVLCVLSSCDMRRGPMFGFRDRPPRPGYQVLPIQRPQHPFYAVPGIEEVLSKEQIAALIVIMESELEE